MSVEVCQGKMSGSSSLIDIGSMSVVRPNLIRSRVQSVPVIIVVSLSQLPFRRLNSSRDISCILLPTEIKQVIEILFKELV